MTLLARTTVTLMVLALAAACRTAVDPLAISDAQTAARVKTALVNDPDLGARTIEVRVVLGVVRLSGRVLTQAEADRAVRIVRGVAGVVDVQAALQIGGQAASPPDEQSQRFELPELDSPELQGNPGFLALGGSFVWSAPRTATLRKRVALSPLIKLGSGRGLGLAVGLDWFQAELQSLAESREVLTRVQIKPVMLGASYTFASERTSLSASLVGGYAWNSLTVTDTGIDRCGASGGGRQQPGVAAGRIPVVRRQSKNRAESLCRTCDHQAAADRPGGWAPREAGPCAAIRRSCTPGSPTSYSDEALPCAFYSS